MTRSILRLDTSLRRSGSATRALTDRVMERLAANGAVSIRTRDLAEGIAPIDETWIGANFTDEADRSPEQRAALALSDRLIAELREADTLVIGLPVYNFGVPAGFKAWVDQIARARVTFRYTPQGPVGLLEGKRAILAVASGGTQVGSAIDFATPYARHVLGFVGIHDVSVIAQDRQMADAEEASRRAEAALARLAA